MVRVLAALPDRRVRHGQRVRPHSCAHSLRDLHEERHAIPHPRAVLRGRSSSRDGGRRDGGLRPEQLRRGLAADRYGRSGAAGGLRGLLRADERGKRAAHSRGRADPVREPAERHGVQRVRLGGLSSPAVLRGAGQQYGDRREGGEPREPASGEPHHDAADRP